MADLIEITRLTSAQPLSKSIHLNIDGSISNDSSRLVLSKGIASRLHIPNMAALADVLDTMPPESALALGTLRASLPDEVAVTSEANVSKTPGAITRSLKNFVYPTGQPGFVLLDFDRKQMPDHVRDALAHLGGFEAALASILPGIQKAGTVRRASTSAGIRNAASGESYGAGGGHMYITIADVADSKRFLAALQDRLWLAGLGWFFSGKSGALSVRSIIDISVGSPERIIFEADPVLGPGLKQGTRRASTREGGLFDAKACAALIPAEREQLKALQDAERARIEPERAAIQAKWIEARVGEFVAKGMPLERAQIAATAWAKGDDLPPETVLQFVKIGAVTIANVLAEPDKFIDEPLADPLEGIEYGRQTAKVLRRPDGTLFIRSHAHGGRNFPLKHSYESILAAIDAAPKSNVAAILYDLVPGAGLDPADVTKLMKHAAVRCGDRESDIRATLKGRIAKLEKAAAEQAREKYRAESHKACLDAPANNAPAGPVMVEWDAILAAQDAPEPPMRDVSGWPVAIRVRAPSGLHQLTADGLAPTPKKVKNRGSRRRRSRS